MGASASVKPARVACIDVLREQLDDAAADLARPVLYRANDFGKIVSKDTTATKAARFARAYGVEFARQCLDELAKHLSHESDQVLRAVLEAAKARCATEQRGYVFASSHDVGLLADEMLIVLIGGWLGDERCVPETVKLPPLRPEHVIVTQMMTRMRGDLAASFLAAEDAVASVVIMAQIWGLDKGLQVMGWLQGVVRPPDDDEDEDFARDLLRIVEDF